MVRAVPWPPSRGSPLLGLAPGWGCLATRLAPDAGALLPRHFTLAWLTAASQAIGFSVALFQQVTPLRALPGAVPCGARTFLG